MKVQTILIFTTVLLSLSFTCTKSTTRSKTDPYSTSSYWNPWSPYPSTTPYPGSTPVPTPYPTFPTVTSSNCDNVVGVNRPSGENRPPWCMVVSRRGGNYYWDSYENYPSTYHDAFLTDSTFKVKLTVNSSPSSCEPTAGTTINSRPYGIVRFNLGISADGVNYFYPYSNIMQNVGQSAVYDLSPYVNRTVLAPQYVRIRYVRSDYSCNFWLECNLTNNADPWCDSYCPAEYQIPDNSCWSMEVQVSTDFHQDFP